MERNALKDMEKEREKIIKLQKVKENIETLAIKEQLKFEKMLRK